MPRGEGNPGEQRCLQTPGGKCFWRCCLLIPFIVFFLMVSVASIVQLCSSSEVLKKESTFLKITEDEDDIHTITLAALCGSVALLTAVGFGACLMIVICARCGEEERCLECRVILLGALLLIMCICLLGGMSLSFSTTGYELLHFKHKDDFQAKFNRGALQSLREFNKTHQVWDTFQKENECCGVNSWKDYRKVFFANTVPDSCCNLEIINETKCDKVRMSVNTSDILDHYIYRQGCSTVVFNAIGELLQLMYWSSTSAGIAACTCILWLCVALIAVCVRTKLKESNNYQQWCPNYEEL